MARARRANPNEQKAYYEIVPKPLYPLYGFVKVGGHLCYVEYLGEGSGNPNYEVMAPNGSHFAPDRIHTLLCETLADLDDATSGITIEPCTEDCQ
jgi:hypothetical protein